MMALEEKPPGGSPKLQRFILRRTEMSAKFHVNVSDSCQDMSHKTTNVILMVALQGTVMGSPKSVRIIVWDSCMSVQKLVIVHRPGDSPIHKAMPLQQLKLAQLFTTNVTFQSSSLQKYTENIISNSKSMYCSLHTLISPGYNATTRCVLIKYMT